MKYVVLFLIFSLFSFGQKKIEKIKIKSDSDTLDYSSLFYKKGYHFEKVEVDKRQVYHSCNKELIFMPPPDSQSVAIFNGRNRMNFKITDTLATCSWYELKPSACSMENCIKNTHDRFGRMLINRRTNSLIIDLRPFLNNKEVILYRFKVIKISNHEIILKDLQKSPQTKLYYFIKN
jgi:hypothetical protein